MKISPHIYAMLLGLSAYTVWCTCDTFNKLASEQGSLTLQTMTVCSLLNMAYMAIKMAAQKNLAGIKPKATRPVVLRSIMNIFCCYCFYTAYTRIPLADAYVLEFTSPFIIAIGAALMLGEHLSRKKIAIIAVGFVGAFVAVDPSFLIANQSDAIGYLAAFGGSVFFSVSQLFSRHLSKTETPEAIMFASNLAVFAAGASLGPTIFTLSPMALLYLFLMSVAGLGGGYLMIASLRQSEAANVASLHYTQIIPGAIYGYFIWHTWPTMNLIIGGLVIVASGLFLTRQPQKQAAIKQTP